MASEKQEVILEKIMGLIMHGGDAKSSAMEAIAAAKEGDFDAAADKLDDADEAINEARSIQSELLKREASGDNIEISLLLVHGQDHLMNAITFKDIASEVIELHQKLAE